MKRIRKLIAQLIIFNIYPVTRDRNMYLNEYILLMTTYRPVTFALLIPTPRCVDN